MIKGAFYTEKSSKHAVQLATIAALGLVTYQQISLVFAHITESTVISEGQLFSFTATVLGENDQVLA